MSSPALENDKEASAHYLRSSFEAIDDTISLSDSAYVDVDAAGYPVGLEILHAETAETQKDRAV